MYYYGQNELFLHWLAEIYPVKVNSFENMQFLNMKQTKWNITRRSKLTKEAQLISKVVSPHFNFRLDICYSAPHVTIIKLDAGREREIKRLPIINLMEYLSFYLL